MKHFLLLLLCSLFFYPGIPQSYFMKAGIKGFNGNRVYLASYLGTTQQITDSTSCLNGEFRLTFKQDMKPGVYRIQLGEKGRSNFFDEDPGGFDFIFNKENILLQTNIGSLTESMHVEESEENRIFYTYLKAERSEQEKLNRLVPLFPLYSQGDEFWSSLEKEFRSVQSGFSNLSDSLGKILPGSIAASVIRISRVPVVNAAFSSEDIRFQIREHYFDTMRVTDSRLINSPYISKVIFDYLSLYMDPVLEQSEQEEQFIIALERLMPSFSEDPAVYDYVLNLLVDSFQKFQMEMVLVYIAETYIGGDCETSSQKLLQKRLEGYEKMAAGKKVPDIIAIDPNEKTHSLYSLTSDYTLVVFWASWCPHCSVFLNQLKKWYDTKDVDLEVYAVSIDSSAFDWEERSLQEEFPWINTISGSGWEGKAPKDYNVYATPTIFLLDNEHRILSKPMTFREFKKDLDKMLSTEVKP